MADSKKGRISVTLALAFGRIVLCIHNAGQGSRHPHDGRHTAMPPTVYTIQSVASGLGVFCMRNSAGKLVGSAGVCASSVVVDSVAGCFLLGWSTLGLMPSGCPNPTTVA